MLYILEGIPFTGKCTDEVRWTSDVRYSPWNYDIFSFKFKFEKAGTAGDCLVSYIGDKDSAVMDGYYLEDIDTDSFQFYSFDFQSDEVLSNSKYGYDKDYIYFIEGKTIYDAGGYFFEHPMNHIVGKNDDDVKILDNKHVVINGILFYQDEEMFKVNIEDIKTAVNSKYIYVNNILFFENKQLETNLILVTNENSLNQDTLFSYNSENIYWGGDMIGNKNGDYFPRLASENGVESNKFNIDRDYYLFDGEKAYYKDVFIGKVDFETFKLDKFYSNDKYQYFCGTSPVPGSIGTANASYQVDYNNSLPHIVNVRLFFDDCGQRPVFEFVCDTDGKVISYGFTEYENSYYDFTLDYVDGVVVDHHCND